MEEVTHRNVRTMMSLLPINPDNPLLVIVVKRENIVDNTLHQIMKCGPCDLKKPLKVYSAVFNSPLSKRVEPGARVGARSIMGLFGGTCAFVFKEALSRECKNTLTIAESYSQCSSSSTNNNASVMKPKQEVISL